MKLQPCGVWKVPGRRTPMVPKNFCSTAIWQDTIAIVDPLTNMRSSRRPYKLMEMISTLSFASSTCNVAGGWTLVWKSGIAGHWRHSPLSTSSRHYGTRKKSVPTETIFWIKDLSCCLNTTCRTLRQNTNIRALKINRDGIPSLALSISTHMRCTKRHWRNVRLHSRNKSNIDQIQSYSQRSVISNWFGVYVTTTWGNTARLWREFQGRIHKRLKTSASVMNSSTRVQIQR